MRVGSNPSISADYNPQSTKAEEKPSTPPSTDITPKPVSEEPPKSDSATKKSDIHQAGQARMNNLHQQYNQATGSPVANPKHAGPYVPPKISSVEEATKLVQRTDLTPQDKAYAIQNYLKTASKEDFTKLIKESEKWGTDKTGYPNKWHVNWAIGQSDELIKKATTLDPSVQTRVFERLNESYQNPAVQKFIQNITDKDVLNQIAKDVPKYEDFMKTPEKTVTTRADTSAAVLKALAKRAGDLTPENRRGLAETILKYEPGNRPDKYSPTRAAAFQELFQGLKPEEKNELFNKLQKDGKVFEMFKNFNHSPMSGSFLDGLDHTNMKYVKATFDLLVDQTKKGSEDQKAYIRNRHQVGAWLEDEYPKTNTPKK